MRWCQFVAKCTVSERFLHPGLSVTMSYQGIVVGLAVCICLVLHSTKGMAHNLFKPYMYPCTKYMTCACGCVCTCVVENRENEREWESEGERNPLTTYTFIAFRRMLYTHTHARTHTQTDAHIYICLFITNVPIIFSTRDILGGLYNNLFHCSLGCFYYNVSFYA